MTSISLESDDSFQDDSIDESALNNVLQLPKQLPTVSSNHVNSIVYEEINLNSKNTQSDLIKNYINYDNIDTIIYPTNLQIRDYQLDIIQKSLFTNLLCAIPTGLGKTFIASTLMLNYFNWFKQLKIIFMAPTKPLVAQQIKAFIKISGISMKFTDILLDRSKRNRKLIWDSKRIFFTTPQVVENDLKSGILNPNEISLLIIDEAHRARGNYSYTNVIKFLNRFNSSFRVLALTATPGSDMESIQSVIENLNISKIEIRTEKDLDIAKYTKIKIIEKLDCEQNIEILKIIDIISEAILPILEKANDYGIYDIKDPTKINHFIAMEKSQKIIKNPSIAEGLKWSYYFILQLLGTVGQFFRRLNIYGIKTFYSYFLDKHTEFVTKFNNKKSTNKLAASFFFDSKITNIKNLVPKLIEDDKQKAISDKSYIEGIFSHTKLKYMTDELIEFFNSKKSSSSSSSSSCIIFTEYRESALEIVKVLENANKSVGKDLLKPHIFIGQAKEKSKFDEESYLDKIKPKRKRDIQITETKSKSKSKSKKDNNNNRPTDRIGSSEDAQHKGMNQKTQKELIENFKNGIFNILVATSIGEEGLDIGEVDLIVCFDSTQSPIKNIQRMGRTGRKRDGKVLLLFSSNERSKFESSMGKYEWIQNQIKSTSNNLEFFDKTNNRILPNNINPKLEMKFIEIPKENEDLLRDSDVIDTDEFLKLATQTIQSKKRSSSSSSSSTTTTTTTTTNGKVKKNKKQSDSNQMKLEKRFFMPANVETGFKPASKLVIKKLYNKDGTEIVENIEKKSSNPLVLDSDDENGDFFSNISTNIYNKNKTDNSFDNNDNNNSNNNSNNNNNNKLQKDYLASDFFSNIAGLSNNDTSIDLTKEDDNDNNETVINEKINSSTPSIIDPILVPDDDFSDVSFDEIDKNIIQNDDQIKIPIINHNDKNKRKLYDLSSDIFSDEIDDHELISDLNKINNNTSSNNNKSNNDQFRPAKRNKN
ncbi:3'-5' DNA helicase [Pichia californica]|uniref:ATP-dependent DNA helicase n=1 Tax=Pichia californica TaxID=460514 RepID=A0A9P6WII0_9ASCO|nr:3'-5' DNA helicase [[Candida] californica]KAG0687419.1 3'-5' DNA helicase [[Candida] californica]